MPKYFWKNKKVLVTGHTGFKGAWLSLWLLAPAVGWMEPSRNARAVRSYCAGG